jgi:hypothetical protein
MYPGIYVPWSDPHLVFIWYVLVANLASKWGCTAATSNFSTSFVRSLPYTPSLVGGGRQGKGTGTGRRQGRLRDGTELLGQIKRHDRYDMPLPARPPYSSSSFFPARCLCHSPSSSSRSLPHQHAPTATLTPPASRGSWTKTSPRAWSTWMGARQQT